MKGGWHGGVMFVFEILFRFSTLPILGALAIRASYTNWMFRRRRLDPLKEYFKSGELWPEETTPMPKGIVTKQKSVDRGTPPSQATVLIFVGLCTAILVMLFPELAFAQGTTSGATITPSQVFTTTASSTPDLFMRLLAYVIPNAGPVGAPDIGVQQSQIAIKSGFTAFCGTLIFLGSSMTGWHILTGLVSSAKEGTALGKNYHEVWAPARVVIGFGMLVPAVQGLCAAQILILYLISWGGNLANLVWAPYVQAVTVGTQTNATQNAQNAANIGNGVIASNSVKGVFQSLLCLEVVNLGNTRMSSSDAQIPVPKQFTTISSPEYASSGGTGTDTLYQMKFGSICGSVDLWGYSSPQGTDQQNTENMVQAQKNAITTMVGTLDTMAKTAAQTYFTTAGSGATASRFFSDQGQGTTDTSNLTTFTSARDGLMQAVTNQIAQQMSTANPDSSQDVTQLRSQAAKDGWAAAGMYYITLTRVQARAFAAATLAYQIQGMTVGNNNGLSATITDALIGTEQNPGAVKQFNQWWSVNFRVLNNTASAAATSSMSNTSDFLKNPMNYFLNLTFGKVSNVFTQRASNTNVIINPMGEMIDFGTTLIAIGEVGYASLAGVVGASAAEQATIWGKGIDAVSGVGAGIGAIIGIISPFATMILLATIAAGVVHAYVIPMTPYIMTVFFVGGMLTLVVEAMAAAPLWAFFHIRMDGQEFVDQVQKPGYMIAFNLILRPVLMIFGLMMSNLVFGAMLFFIDYTFVPAANGLAATTGIGFFAMFVMIIMMSYLDYQVGMRSFQLIVDIPERVSRWFGQGGDHLGDDQHATKVTGAFIGGMENRAASLGTGLANKQRLDNAGAVNMPKEKKTPSAPGSPPEVPPPPSGKD